MPRKSFETAGGVLFGGETRYRIIRELIEKQGELVRESNLSRSVDSTSSTVSDIMDSFIKYLPELFEVKHPYADFKGYRIKKESKLFPFISNIIMYLEETPKS